MRSHVYGMALGRQGFQGRMFTVLIYDTLQEVVFIHGQYSFALSNVFRQLINLTCPEIMFPQCHTVAMVSIIIV